MDPDATLAEIRQLNEKAKQAPLGIEDTDQLSILIEALDEWLTKGGFLPTEWNALRSPLRETTSSGESVFRIQRGGVGTRAGN